MITKQKEKIYTVSETITIASIYKVRASTEPEAIDKVRTDNELKKHYSFTTDIFYQIED